MTIKLSTIYALTLVLVYLNLSFQVGSDLLIFAMAVLLCISFQVKVKATDIYSITALLFVLLILLLFSWGRIGDLSYLFGAVIQFCLSLFFGIITYRLIICSCISDKVNFLPKVLLLFGVLIVLELLDVTRGLSNAYRQSVLGVTSDIISNEHIRDIEMTHWFFRPNVFSKEASIAYLFFFTISSCYLLQKENIRVALYLVLINVLLFFVYRTPSVALTLIMYFTIIYFNKYKYFTRLKKIHVLCFYIFALFFCFMMKDLLLERFSDIDFDDVNRMNSITIRVVAPLHFMIQAVKDYPLFGIGLGNLELFEKQNIAVGNNALFYFIAFLGIIGTIIFFCFLVFWLIVEKLSEFKDIIIIITFFALLSLQTGGILNFRMWFYFFTFLAYYKCSKNPKYLLNETHFKKLNKLS